MLTTLTELEGRIVQWLRDNIGTPQRARLVLTVDYPARVTMQHEESLSLECAGEFVEGGRA